MESVQQSQEEEAAVAARRKMKFEAEDDLFLLKEAAAENPFEDGARWKVIAEKMKRVITKPFSARNLRERVNHLLVKFEEHFQEWKTVSGKDEAHIERISLLEEVRNLKKDFQGRKVSSGKSKESQAGKELRAEAAKDFYDKEVIILDEDVEVLVQNAAREESLPHDEPDHAFLAGNILPEAEKPQHVISIQPPGPTARCSNPCVTTATAATTPASSKGPRTLKRKRGLNASVEKYMLEKQAQDVLLKRRHLELEERRLALDERRLDSQIGREDTVLSYLQQIMERQESLLEMVKEVLENIKKP